jgi:hypothetical protein
MVKNGPLDLHFPPKRQVAVTSFYEGGDEHMASVEVPAAAPLAPQRAVCVLLLLYYAPGLKLPKAPANSRESHFAVPVSRFPCSRALKGCLMVDNRYPKPRSR